MVVTWTPDSKNVVFLSRRVPGTAGTDALRGAGAGRPGATAAARPRRADDLQPRRQFHRLHAHLPRFPHLEALQWRPQRGRRHLQFPDQETAHITTWHGNQHPPMWYGHKIYFLSDHDTKRRENIWVYDLDSKQFREITHFTNYDIDFPSLGVGGKGGDGIVFAQAGALWVIDLPSEKLHRLNINVPDDQHGQAALRGSEQVHPRPLDTAQNSDYALSPNGKRAVFSARGDIFTVPAEHGATRNLTNSSNADEDHPNWSPDGKTIAYTTDVNGEHQIAVRPATAAPRRFSPISRMVSITDHCGRRTANGLPSPTQSPPVADRRGQRSGHPGGSGSLFRNPRREFRARRPLAGYSITAPNQQRTSGSTISARQIGADLRAFAKRFRTNVFA